MSYLTDDEADALIRALFSMIYELHPTYASTAGRHGGIGGSMLTRGCSYAHPETESEIMASVEWVHVALSNAFLAADRAGINTSTLKGYGIPHPHAKRTRKD